MASSWLGRACVVVVVVVAVWTVGSESSALADNRRRASTLDRFLTRLCDAILAAGDDDAIDDRKRKWGDNTMMSWGKRDVVDSQYALSVCESLERNRRPPAEQFVSVWEQGSDGMDTKGRHGWSEHDVKLANKRSHVPGGNNDDEAKKRKWGDNSMATWGKRKWGENSMATWGKRHN